MMMKMDAAKETTVKISHANVLEFIFYAQSI